HRELSRGSQRPTGATRNSGVPFARVGRNLDSEESLMRLDGQLDHQCEEVRPLRPAFRNIPDELKSLPRWVVLAHTPRNGEWKKVPYTAADPTRWASSTDAETWGTYDAALAAYMTQVVRLDGVGFMLDGSGYVAV